MTPIQTTTQTAPQATHQTTTQATTQENTVFDATLAREDLLPALSLAIKTLPASIPTGSPLAGVLLTANGDDETVTVTATDADTWITQVVEAEPGPWGRVLVAGKRLRDLVRKLDKGSAVRLAADEIRLAVGDGELTYRLATMAAPDYPEPPPGEGAAIACVPGPLLHQAARVASAAADDGSGSVLNCVRLETRDGGLEVIATDTYRAARYRTGVTAALPRGLNIPAPALALAADAVQRSERVWLSRLPVGGGEAVRVTDGARSVLTRTWEPEGRDYPNVRALFPTGFTATVTVEQKQLLKAVGRVAAAAERNTPIVLALHDNRVAVEARRADEVSADTYVPADCRGDALRVAVAPRYLADAVTATGADTAHIEFTGEATPFVVSAAHDPALTWLQVPVQQG